MSASGKNSSPSQLPDLDPLDPRLNAARPDLANIRLKSRFDATLYTSGEPGTVCVPVADIKGTTNPDSDNTHQLLLGEEVWVFEDINERKWVQSRADGYVGYVNSSTVSIELDGNFKKPNGSSHIVRVPTTFCYPKAELRNPPLYSLSMGSRVTVLSYQVVRDTKYALLEGGGALIEKHLVEVNDFQTDYVKSCELLTNTPYLWGGSSAFGIDCSSLVQLSMRMCGREVLRDSDMQAATIGLEIEAGEYYQNLKRGDLIFWRSHVAIHQGNIDGAAHIIHASGHTMNVAAEPLHQAIERIAYLYEKPIGYRRP